MTMQVTEPFFAVVIEQLGLVTILEKAKVGMQVIFDVVSQLIVSGVLAQRQHYKTKWVLTAIFAHQTLLGPGERQDNTDR